MSRGLELRGLLVTGAKTESGFLHFHQLRETPLDTSPQGPVARVLPSPWADMCSFQVDIRFPQTGAPDPNCVTVTGLPENVEEAIDHILNLEEEYVSGTWAAAGQLCVRGWPAAA